MSVALKNDSLVARDASQGDHTKNQQSTSRDLASLGIMLFGTAYAYLIRHLQIA